MSIESIETARARKEAWERADRIVCHGEYNVGEMYAEIDRELKAAKMAFQSAQRRAREQAKRLAAMEANQDAAELAKLDAERQRKGAEAYRQPPVTAPEPGSPQDSIARHNRELARAAGGADGGG